jgi:hypothetical protein
VQEVPATAYSPALSRRATEIQVDRIQCLLMLACFAGRSHGSSLRRSRTVARNSALFADLGVVKPYGRLGPLRSEWVAPGPRAAYRRGGLPRPFKRLEASGEFILGRASHLDAFSGYHSQPSLPGAAPGGTTGTRAGRPTRSSRTRVRSPQLSNAHDGYRPNCLTTF